MRFEGYYEDRELPLKRGDTVTIKKGTRISTPTFPGSKERIAKRTYKVKVHHFMPGMTDINSVQSEHPPFEYREVRKHRDNPKVCWPGESGYWFEVDLNDIPEATSALPKLAEVERKLGEKADKWGGRCYEIACAIVRKGLVDGTAVYGHFVGDVHPESYFGKEGRAGLPFIQHGWILLKKGGILDPTRWAFEAKEPYLHFGPLTDEYDEGGNQLRVALHRPPPEFDPDAKQVTFTKEVLPSAPWTFIEKKLGIDITAQEPGTISIEQLFWLANAPYDFLQPHTMAIYKAIDAVGWTAAIPKDNRNRAVRES